eukprot:CAMPEP_0197866234 /NCGR_PEP_ID=MMETSP1438-20131217/44106_1 /TAXON_ID=1461541 /ORGANISM="Pterosperma sp., Strain CCMP1384" /LENGTH=233 /DNA_ID=CAMNT_0043484787 /DNA_START=526 /DNA_END=1226 /DNA_ORIENTATION=+
MSLRDESEASHRGSDENGDAPHNRPDNNQGEDRELGGVFEGVDDDSNMLGIVYHVFPRWDRDDDGTVTRALNYAYSHDDITELPYYKNNERLRDSACIRHTYQPIKGFDAGADVSRGNFEAWAGHLSDCWTASLKEKFPESTLFTTVAMDQDVIVDHLLLDYEDSISLVVAEDSDGANALGISPVVAEEVVAQAAKLDDCPWEISLDYMLVRKMVNFTRAVRQKILAGASVDL